jgi:hypothetical protein
MLSLIFSRAKKRNVIGLLALGEWGPPSGAISGSVATQQAPQQDLASGTVVEPVVHVVGGGGGGGGWGGWVSVRSAGEWRAARTAISGSVKTQQARQQTLAVGTVVAPVYIPVILVPRRTSEAIEITLTVVGEMSDDELEILTAALAAAV